MANPGFQLIIHDRDGPRTVDLGPDPAAFGRSPENTIRINHESVSLRHGEIRVSPAGVELRDLGSSNGTFVNGKRIERHMLTLGDDIQIGRVKVEFTARATTGPDRDLGEVALAGPGGEASGYALVIVEGEGTGDRLPLARRPLKLGRSSSNDIVLTALGVSGEHAEIVWEEGTPVLRDLESTNGLVCGGRRVKEVALRGGTTVRIGTVTVRVDGPVEEIEIGGAVDTETTAADETLQFHHLSDAALPARRRRGLPILALLGVALAAAAYFYLQPSSKGNLGGLRSAVTPPAESLLRAGFSAEEPDAVDRWPVESAKTGALARAAAAKRSGRFGYVLERLEAAGPDRPTVAVYRAPLPVDSRRRYTVQAAVRRAAGDVEATLAVRLLGAAGEVIHEVFGPRVAADAFETVELTPTAPEGCVAAQVALVVLGGRGTAHFDDIVFKPSERPPAKASHAAGRLTVEISPHGVWSLRADGEWPLTRMEYVAEAGGVRFLQTLATRVAAGQLEAGEGRTRFAGVFHGARGQSGPLVWVMEGSNTVTFTCQPWALPGVARDGVTFCLRPGDVKGGLLIAAGGQVFARRGPFSSEAVGALVIGSGSRAFRLAFEPPLDLVARVAGKCVRVEASRRAHPGTPLKLTLNPFLNDLLTGALTALRKGREALDDGRFGDAFRQLHRVLREFPVRRDDVETAARLLERVKNEFRARFAEVKKRADQALFFKDRGALTAALASARSLQATYKETPVESEASAVVDALRTALEHETARENERVARRNLLLARDCKERGDVHFAERYFQLVINRCRGSRWAAEARKELEELRRVVSELNKTRP